MSSEVEIAAHLGEVLWVKARRAGLEGFGKRHSTKSQRPAVSETLLRFGVQLDEAGIDQYLQTHLYQEVIKIGCAHVSSLYEGAWVQGSKLVSDFAIKESCFRMLRAFQFIIICISDSGSSQHKTIKPSLAPGVSEWRNDSLYFS